MRISTQLDYADGNPRRASDHVRALEAVGLDVVWVPEAYSFDAVSLMGYLAATTETVQIASGILPIYTRTPSLLAMTAAGIDSLSDGRCILGLGASGPQVVEGFHGVQFENPLGRTGEIIDICRAVWARQRVEHEGRNYTIPLPADQGTGLGKPLKLINHPVRSRIPIYVAALGARSVRMTAEKADGWMPALFAPELAKSVWGHDLVAGSTSRSPELAPLEIVAGGLLAIGPDAAKYRELYRPTVALYVGGMGARGHNFYNDVMCRSGFEREAQLVQDLYLDGRKDEAAAAVPDAFIESTTLCGDAGYLSDRIAAFRDAGVTMLNVRPVGDDPIADVAALKALL